MSRIDRSCLPLYRGQRRGAVSSTTYNHQRPHQGIDGACPADRFYGLAEDIAETVLFCATRPPHVNIQEVLVMPQDQAAVYASHPRGVD